MNREEVISWTESTRDMSAQILHVFFENKNEYEPNDAIRRIMNQLAEINNAAVVVGAFFKYGFKKEHEQLGSTKNHLKGLLD